MAKKLRNTTPEIDEWDEFEFFDLDNFDDLAEDTKDKSGLKYIKNVFKSVKNVSVKIGEALLPQTSGLAGEIKNAGAEFKDQFTTYKDKAIDQIAKFKGKSSGQNLSKEAIGETASALFTDLKKDVAERFKTGKFVKGPEDENFDMDFGFGGDDDDDESSESSQPQSTLKEEKDPNAPVRAKIVQAKNRNKRLQFDLDNERFQSLKEATLGASEASVSANIEMFNKSQMLEEARHHVTTQYLKNMAVNIYKLTGIQGQSLAANIEYGKKTLALYADITRFIKEMHEMQSIVHRENEKFRNKSRNGSRNKLEEIFGYGFSGSEWAKGIVGNVKDTIEMSPIGMMMGMLPMLDMMNMGGSNKGGIGGTVKNFAKSINPFNLLLNLVMSSQMKRGRERIEKLFGALPALINQRFVSMQDEGGLKGLIGTILGIRDTEGVVKTEKFSNMNLDSPTSFDVRSKRALTEVIPLRLARIEAALTGKEETRYDYKSGKFKTVGSIQREKENIKMMAMNSDLDFAKAVEKINTEAGADKKTIDALNAMHMQLVNLQQGFDWNRFNEVSKDENGKERLTRDAIYYRNLIASKVNGSKEDKEKAINAFAAGYKKLIDEDSALGKLYLSGMPLVKSAYGRGLNNWAENLNDTTEGALNTISTGQHTQSIKKLRDDLKRLQKIRDDDTVAFSKNQINKKIAETQMKLAQLAGESGGGFLNVSTVDIADQSGYNMEQKFMSVPNMLKNITEILLHGIVVYPASSMPKEVMSFMGSQKSYLSNESKRASDAVRTQLSEEQKAREEANEVNLQRMQTYRDWTQKETGLAATGFGKWVNRRVGDIYNLFNQAILSPLGGFDGTYDFNETAESRANSQNIYNDRSGAVRKFASNLSEKNGIRGKIGNVLLGLTASVDNALMYTKEKEEEKSELATKVTSKIDQFKNAISKEIEKHPFIAEKAELLKKMLKKNPDQAEAVINEIEKGAAEGKSADEIINQAADNTLDEEFYKQLSFMKEMKGSTSKISNKSKVVDKSVSNSYNRIKKITNVSMTTKPIEERLDIMIDLLKANQKEDGYQVSGMPEVISLLVSLNASQMAPQELTEISNAIQKIGQVKKTLVGKILGLPKYIAGKGRDLVKWTGDRAVGGFNQVMDWGRQMLPGIGNFGRGVLGEAWTNVKAFGAQIPGFFGGIYGGAKSAVGTGINKASELLNQAKTRVRAELDQLAENGGLNIETLLSRFSREELIEKLASVTGKSPEELANLDNRELASELIRFWKSKAGIGIGGVAEGLSNIGRGTLDFGKEALKQTSESVRGIGQNIYDAGKSALSNVGGFLSNLVGPNGSLISIGGNSNKNLMKALLANTIAIRTLMETHYGISSNIEAATSEADKISNSKNIKASASKVGAMLKGFGSNLGNSRLAKFIKNKLPGHRDRGDGSGISEGSYEDYKKDAQEAKVEQREEAKEDYLAQIAENTALLANISNVGPQEKEKIKPNFKGFKAGLGIAGGAALVAGGAALFAGNFMANKKKKEQYEAAVENGSMTQEEANREGKLDNVEKGNMMARSVVMAIKGVDKILNALFKMKPLNKFITGPIKNIIQKSITNALTKFAPKIGARLAAFLGIGAGSAGISTVVQAAAGFVWGMARASSYFKDILGPGQKITLAMRVTAGLVKALDFALMGIPDIICTFMGTNAVMWIYNMIKDVIGGPSSDNGKWLKQRADIYGLKSAKDIEYVINNKNNSSWKKLGFKSKKIFDEWYSRRFEPLYQLEEQLSGGKEDIIDGSCEDQAAVENFRKNFISKAKQLIEKEKIGHLTYASSENDLGTDAAGAAVIGGAAGAAGVAGATAMASNISGGKVGNASTTSTSQLSEMTPESTTGEVAGPLAMIAAGASMQEVQAVHGKKGINPSEIPNFYYANVASLANLIAIRKILEIQSGVSIRIEDAQLEAEKIASTGEKMSNTDSGSFQSAMGSAKRKGGGILSKVSGFIGNAMNNVSEWFQDKGKDVETWANNQSNPIIQKVGSTVGQGAQKVGQGIQNVGEVAKTIYERGKGFLMSNPLTKNLFPQQSPSPYLVPNTQSSAGGARADINNVNPSLRDRLVAFAQHYYDIVGKPLKINSGKRSLQQQIKMWEAQSKVKWTGNRAKDTEATIKAGGKFFGVNNGTVGYPNPNAAHIAGRGIDIDIASTPFANEVDAIHRHWLFDDILEQYGLKRTLVRANGYTGGSLERWHIGATDAPVDPKILQNEQPPVASLKEQMIDEIPIQVGTKSDNSTSPQSSSSQTQSSSSSTETSSDNKISTTSSQTTSSQTTSSSVSSNTGMNDLNQQINEVGGLVKIMEKIEENTKKSADILAEHLPKLGNIFQMLGAILQATLNNGSGGSGNGQSEADMAATIIAKANY